MCRENDGAYLFLDGVGLRVRRPSGRKRGQRLVAYGVKPEGRRRLLAFLRSPGESQADWEALLNALYRRGLQGNSWHLIVTDGCPGWRRRSTRCTHGWLISACWVHQMRNILET